jgi:hypothetical protein
MTQLNTLLNGGSALAAVVFAFICLIITIVWYIKTKNKTFISGILLTLAVGFGWMGITLSFLSVVLFNENIPYLYMYVRLFSYSTAPVGTIATLNVGWDLFLSSKYKKLVLIAMIIISVFYYIILYMNIDTVTEIPAVAIGEIYDDWLVPLTMPYFMFLGMTGFVSTVLAISFFKFFKKTSGDIRKRAILIVLAAIFLGSAVLMDTVIFIGEIWKDLLFIPRIQVVLGLLFMLLGFKPA